MIALTGSVTFAQQDQPLLQIASPPDGTVVFPGQTLTVVVSPLRGVTFRQIVIIGQDPIGFSEVTSGPPLQTLVTIPQNTTPGRYLLTASGVMRQGQGAESDPITLLVERAEIPVGLSADPLKLVFDAQGEQMTLRIVATFSDGSTVDVTRSPNMTYNSTNSSVATVDPAASVIAGGPGQATIVARYNQQAQSPQVSIPIVVTPLAITLFPSTLDFGNQPVGAASQPQTMTLTNTDNVPLRFVKVMTGGEFAETDNCATSSPFPVGGTCMISVSFTPVAAGVQVGALRITNSARAATVVTLKGAGTVVPFAAFSVRLEIEDSSNFYEHGVFRLAREDTRLDPSTEAVILSIGDYSLRIPAGSFRSSEGHESYFEGKIAGVSLTAEIEPEHDRNNSYKFKIEGKGLDLSSSRNLVSVGLMIGDNVSAIKVRAKFDRESDDDL
jgi:hypothetical protein